MSCVFVLCVSQLYIDCTDSVYSACAGLVSAILGTPADVVKTRIMNQQYVDGR